MTAVIHTKIIFIKKNQKQMTGDYRAAFGGQMACGLALLWGFSVVNIPIGVGGCFYNFGRAFFEKSDECSRRLHCSAAFLISALPVFGPICAIKYLKG